MGRIIEAKAVISAEDRTGKAFDAIGRKFKEIGKGAKVAADVGKLGRELDAAARGLRDIERFRGAQASFAQARTTYRTTQAEINRLAGALAEAKKAATALEGVKTFSKNGTIAKEMAAARREVSELERQFASAQRAVKAASAAYESQAAALKGVKRELDGSGLSTSKIAGEQKRLEAAVEGVNTALERQAKLQAGHRDVMAGMSAAGRRQSDQLRREAAEAAQARRLTDGLSAPARAAAEARARATFEAEQAELRRRASASGDLIAGMGRATARTAEGRRLAEGMGRPGQLARAEAERLREEAAERRATLRAERREAAGAIGAGAGIIASHKGRTIAKGSIEAAAEFDLAVRKQKVFTDIDYADQAGLLAQARKIGQETQFSNIDVVKAQTASMQGLPAGFAPSLKAAVAEGIVGNVRNYATLMETDLKEGAETIRGYLQQTGKDISTKEKALFEANKATNQLVKMAKLGGMNGEDVAQFMKYAASSATSAGLTTDSLMSIGALARRGGLRGDEAGVFMRSTANKLVSPTKKGLAAYNAAGIKHSDYVRMPDQLSTGNLEGQFQLEMGKGFTPAIRKRLDAINKDKSIIGDQGKYVQAVVEAVSPILGRTKKGTVRASDAKVAAKAAGGYHKVAAQSVDAEGLLDALMKANPTLAQLNAILTDKHGGKGAITQRQWDEFKAAREQIGKAADDPDWAKKKADEVFAGVGGAVENLKGSFENLILTIGNANASLIKWSADSLGTGLDSFSKLPEPLQQGLSLTALAGSTLAGVWGTLKLARLALGLGGGAVAAGTAAAGGAAVAGGVAGGAAAAGAGAASAPAAAGTLAALGLGGVGLGTLAGAGFAAYATAKTMPKLAAEQGAAGIDYATGGALDANPMAGMAPERPWLRDWWKDNAPGWLGGSTPEAKAIGPYDFSGKTIPVEVMSLPKGEAAPSPAERSVPLPPARPAEFGRSDASGQVAAVHNTLDKAATASATAANGGQPIEATVKPDQIVARIDQIPPVTGQATVTVDNQHHITIQVDAEWVKAQATTAAKQAVAAMNLTSGGARTGAATMPGAAAPPGGR